MNICIENSNGITFFTLSFLVLAKAKADLVCGIVFEYCCFLFKQIQVNAMYIQTYEFKNLSELDS